MKAKAQVHTLHRLGRRPFQQIVLCGNHDQMLPLQGEADVAKRRTRHRADGRQRSLTQADQRLILVGPIKSRRHLGRIHAAFYPQMDRLQYAARKIA